MSVDLYDPATGEKRETRRYHDRAQTEARLDAVARYWKSWRRRPVGERTEVLERIADALEARAADLAQLMALEMGKPLEQGRGEAEKCAAVCRYYAENAESFLQPKPLESDARMSRLIFRPLGVVFAIMPWNFPFWQLFRAGAPAIAAGNAILLKHAPNVQGCADAIVDLFKTAGVPHLLQSVFVTDDDAAKIIQDDRIAGVTLTGSARAGRSVAATAGKALKPVVLELGGSDPYVICHDADLDLAADKCVQGRMVNNGQTCIAAKRWIVVDEVHEPFRDKVLDRLKEYTMGPPTKDGVNQGPMAREDLRETLHRQVRESIGAGAECLLGGEVPDRQGYFYPATLLDRVEPGMPAFDEEVFGPVGAIVPAADESAAIALANQSAYGLGAGIFSKDVDRATRIAEDQLEAGTCVVNDFVRSDPRLPFGGIGQSGFGRELGRDGILEFVNRKTINID